MKNGITNKTRMRTNWGYRNEDRVEEGQTSKIQAQKVKTIDWDKIAFTYPPVFLGDCKPSWSEKIHHVSQLEAAINGVKHKSKKSGRRVGVPATGNILLRQAMKESAKHARVTFEEHETNLACPRTVDHFPVSRCLFFKASLSARFFMVISSPFKMNEKWSS